MVLTPGTRLGPYEVTALLGAGGMGEVYRARDSRLNRLVALKVLKPEVAGDADGLARFEREAQAVASLNHPNILTVHDVGVHAGTPYVVTELLEGENLRDVVSQRAPTERQVLGWAVQAAQGLAAAHQKGIVQRDLKPENLFLTADGRVKILDFGLAKQAGPVSAEDEALTAAGLTTAGMVMGTIAYMSPEQVEGRPVDARSDLFSFGAVLYELLAKSHPFRRETSGATIGAILQETPPPLSSADPSIPRAVDGIVRRCLEKRREDRFQDARELALVLEAVLAAPAGSAVLDEVEERSPYPGLSFFTEEDASRFFGREEEVKALWEKLRARRLLAVIGPSGTGKTSFVRAGVVAGKPAGWAALVCTPGTAPLRALGQALGPALAHDPEALRQLVSFDDPDVAFALLRRWGQAHGEALLVLDQFEELFTLNPAEVQASFAALIARIAADADVHVVLSLRDDFLMRCHEHDALAPVFDALTPLGAITRANLRRAIVEPARARGYRFEDDGLVDEMVECVEGTRAALPMLAFAVARLWDQRDREQKVLTRAAYEQIGGVAGALAQHAEAALDRIGSMQQDLVRELFRNLVTAQGTRAVIDRDELLSAIPDRQAGEKVLRELIDARLLTSYEVDGEAGEPARQRIEIVHESLLKAWPRLVRWQTQDENGAQLRDQLKQAAHLWDDKGRSADLLWTGTVFEEYALWRQRYPGTLTALEDDFARSMAAKARRRARLRRAAVAAGFLGITAVAVAIGIMGQRAARARDEARAEAGQREAAQLLALGRLQLAESPSAALAYAVASLERSDNDPARRFAVEALWQAPPALQTPWDTFRMQWSPDGRWVAFVDRTPPGLSIVSREKGERRQLSSRNEAPVGFTSDGARLVTGEPTPDGRSVLRIWALPDGRLERTLPPEPVNNQFVAADGRLLRFLPDALNKAVARARRLSLDGTVLNELGPIRVLGMVSGAVDPAATSFFAVQDGRVLQYNLDALSSPPRVFGAHEGKVSIEAEPWLDQIVTGDEGGEVRIWNVPEGRLERTLKSPARAWMLGLDPKNRFLVTGPSGAAARGSVVLFDLAAPRSADPMLLPGPWSWVSMQRFSPDGAWLVTSDQSTPVFWNMTGPRSIVLGRQQPPEVALAFSPDGHLLSTSGEGVLRRWPISYADGEDVREYRPGVRSIGGSFELDREGRSAVLTASVPAPAKVLIVPLDGSEPVRYELKDKVLGSQARVDPSGRLVALSAGSNADPKLNGVRVIDLATREERRLDTLTGGAQECGKARGAAVPVWLSDGRLITDGYAGLRVWDLASGRNELLRPCRPNAESALMLLVTPDSRSVVRLDVALVNTVVSSFSVFDLASRVTREITSHGNVLSSFALDPSGRILVSGDRKGVIRVGPLTGEAPHLLYGHTGAVTGVAISTDGRWIASGGDDGTIRRWPMPDLSKPPLHTLPHDALVATLRALTNLRAARDPGSDTGWKIEVGPFPGWAKVPTWNP